jgi:hypothetical protein
MKAKPQHLTPFYIVYLQESRRRLRQQRLMFVVDSLRVAIPTATPRGRLVFSPRLVGEENSEQLVSWILSAD